jgi:uncharacterized protein YdhG (YjbR/CyaY superfamily)
MAEHTIADNVGAWIADVPPEHRELFDTLHDLILATLPAAEVALSYNMPAYKVGSRRVSLGRWKGGVVLCTTTAEPVADFRRRHPQFGGGKVTIQFAPGQDLPTADIADLITTATAT